MSEPVAGIRGGAAYATGYVPTAIAGDHEPIGHWRGAGGPPLFHARGGA